MIRYVLVIYTIILIVSFIFLLPNITYKNIQATAVNSPELLNYNFVEYDHYNPINKDLKVCVGNWFEVKGVTKRIELYETSLLNWNEDSKDSVVTSSVNSSNIVVLGHNDCSNGNCIYPTTEFSKIINSKIGDNALLCLNNVLYDGYITFSAPVLESSVHLLDKWLEYDSITAITCWGECRDKQCSSVDSRWVISFPQ